MIPLLTVNSIKKKAVCKVRIDLEDKIVIIKYMDGLNIRKIIANIINPQRYLQKIKQEEVVQQRIFDNGLNNKFSNNLNNQNQTQNIGQQLNNANQPIVGDKFNNTQNINTNNSVQNNSGVSSNNTNLSLNKPSSQIANQPEINSSPKMNQIASMDRSVYVKNLLGLPQNLADILLQVQNKNNPINTNTLMLNNIKEDVLQNQKVMSQLFDDTSEIPLNVISNIATQSAAQQAAPQNDAMALLFSGMIHMPAVSEAILKNSKQAVAQLIIAMASASKSGMTNEQIRETLSVINNCVSLADAGTPAQTLKSLMMLYLPWLPLNDGVGFDLEVEQQNGENKSIDSKLTVLIQTRNYGNVKGVFTLTTSNSIDAYIICSEDFPKNTLKKKLINAGQSHSMNTTIDIESVTPIKKENENQEAKVNLSATNEMNPYLLLIAHAFIRETIEIDTASSNGALAANITEE